MSHAENWDIVDETDNLPTRSHEVLDSDQGRLMAGGGAVATTGAQYSTAMRVQNPRALTEVKRRLLEEARELGETAFYGWGSGKDAVTGPSISLAMAAARSWGNCAVQPEPIQELPDAYVFSYAFIDLETGFTIARQFRQSKHWTVYGKMDAARKEDIRFQIGQSKAQRNVILSVLPKSLINAAMKAAQSGVREKVQRFIDQKGLAAAQDLIVRGLAKHGVTEQMILDRVGVAELKGIDVDDIVRLRGDLHAIEDGQERAEALFDKLNKQKSTGAVDGMLEGEEPSTEEKTEPSDQAEPDDEQPNKAKSGKSNKSKSQKSKPQGGKEAKASPAKQKTLTDEDADMFPDGFLAELAECKSVGQVETLFHHWNDADPADGVDRQAIDSACQQRIAEIRAQYRQL